MKITFTPETIEEKRKYQEKGIDEVVYTNVHEYFIFGNKTDEEDSLIDLHEWHGGYRYLLGSLQYFYEIINDMRKDAGAPISNAPKSNRAKVDLKLMQPTPKPMIKTGEVDDSNIQILDIKPDLPNFRDDDDEQKVKGFKTRDIPNTDEDVRKTLEKIESDLVD